MVNNKKKHTLAALGLTAATVRAKVRILLCVNFLKTKSICVI